MSRTPEAIAYAARLEAKFGPWSPAKWVRDMRACGYKVVAYCDPSDGKRGLYVSYPSPLPPLEDDPAPLINLGDADARRHAVIEHLAGAAE